MLRNFQLLITLPDQSTLLLAKFTYKSRDGERTFERMAYIEQSFSCLAEFGEVLLIGYRL